MPPLWILLQRDFRKTVNSESLTGVPRDFSEARTLPPVRPDPELAQVTQPRSVWFLTCKRE